jgi:hypothetical protein
MFKKHIILSALFLLTSFSIFAYERYTKTYFNNILSGGKERIKIIKGDIDKIDIYKVIININLSMDYSSINAVYYIKNKQEESEIEFLYPKIDSIINKTIKTYNNGDKNISKKNIIINGDYSNFIITEDNKIINFEITSDDINDTSIPYKIGDTSNIILNSGKKTTEEIDSYIFKYSWYTARIKFSKNEKKVIKISYSSPLYYNMIEAEKNNKFEIKEDPALKYITTDSNGERKHISEKIFNFMLYTPYSDNEKVVKNLIINLRANTISPDYLKILPLEYAKKNNIYIWHYRNLKAKSINNILVKITPAYSENTEVLANFKVIPDKTRIGKDDYYKIDTIKDSIIIEHQKGMINIKEIRLFPEHFEYKSQLANINLPLEFQIEFDQTGEFSNPKIYNKSIPSRKIIGSIIKNSYFTIYKSEGIDCKFVRIKFLKTNKNDNNIINISNIQIIK